MATGRMIRASMSSSARLGSSAQLPDEFCQVLYLLLIVHADDFGMLAGDAWTRQVQVRADVYPFDGGEVDEALDGMAAVGLIKRYEVGEQQVIPDRAVRRPPERPSQAHSITFSTSRRFQAFPGTSGYFRECPGNSRTQRKRTERKRREENVPDAEASDD